MKIIFHKSSDVEHAVRVVRDDGSTDSKVLNSRSFLRHCTRLLNEQGYRLVNADLTLLAEAPRLGSHRAEMRANVAADLETTVDRVNVKATTCEGLGAIGRAEGLACHAVVLIARAEGGSHGRGQGHEHGR